MNILKIKNAIENMKNKPLHFKINGSRNQIEEFDGKIIETYNYIFIIETNNIKKSFTYSDILIENLEIKEIA